MEFRQFGIWPLLLMYIIFPVTYSLSKMATFYIPPVAFIALRMIPAGLAMLGLYFRKNKVSLKIDFTDTMLFTKAAFFGIYLTYTLELWALQYLSISQSAFMFILTVICALVFAYFFENEIFTPKKKAGLFVGLLGFLPIFLVEKQTLPHLRGFFVLGIPELTTIISMICYVYSWIPMKQLLNEKNYSPLLVNGIIMTGGGIAAAFTSFFIDGWSIKNNFSFDNVPYIFTCLGVILFVEFVSYVLYSHLLRHFSISLIALFGFIEPFFASLYGHFFLQESISVVLIPSLVIVSLGLYIFSSDELAIGRNL